MCPVAGNSANKRQSNHGIEHAHPAELLAYPADRGPLHKRADRADPVDEADDGAGRVATLHLAQLGGKGTDEHQVGADVQEADGHHDDWVDGDAHARGGDEEEEGEGAEEGADGGAEQGLCHKQFYLFIY